jgi:hypothetical protein
MVIVYKAQELFMSARSRRFLFFACILAAIACSASLWADPPSRVGRLGLISGSVSFRPGSLDEWAPATLNYPVTTGDNLWTDTGARAELHLGSAAVRLGAETDFSILLLDDQTVQLRLSQGALNIRLRDLQADESFEIATPQASISLLEPGSYRVDVQNDGTTDVVARSGRAELASGASSVTVSSNQYAAVTDIAAGAFEFRVAPAPDEWELWCMQRDQREDRFASSQYVPATMVGYEDLDEYGSWQFFADYGTCWIPRGVPAGWAPYHFGHWAWVEPWGWTWIDDAPWGFAPFHYGRWAHVNGVWVWAPGVFVARPIYAPALVVFIGGAGWGAAFSLGEGVGWFPLGPREVYMPPYRVSNVYIRNVNIAYVTNIDVERIDVRHFRYANRSISGAVTVVRREAFVRAEPVARAAVQVRAADISSAPVTGMGPSLAPERESILARPQGARQAVPRPPASAQDRPVVVRHAPPPAQYPEERQAGAPERPRFNVVNPPRLAPSVQPTAQPPRREPLSPDLQQPMQAPAAEQRQAPAVRQEGTPGQDRSSERRQVDSGARQGREGPAIVPETRGKSKQPAGSGPLKKKKRKLVDGPNGPVWEWVEE